MKILTKGKYYGEKKMEHHTNGVVLSEYNYNTPKTDWHYHENPYFMYVLQGNVFDFNKKKSTTCSSGSLLLHNWNEVHCNTKESDFARGFHIEFERGWYEEKKLDVDLWEGSKRIEDPIMHHLLGKLYVEFRNRDAHSALEIDLLLLQLCEASQSNHIKEYCDPPAWINRLKELLHDGDTTGLNLQGLSETLGVHPVHLSRTIPKYFSSGLSNYLRRQKVKKALNYLFDPSYSLTEIPYLCGFADQSHFSRTFKGYFGATPKVYRARLV